MRTKPAIACAEVSNDQNLDDFFSAMSLHTPRLNSPLFGSKSYLGTRMVCFILYLRCAKK